MLVGHVSHSFGSGCSMFGLVSLVLSVSGCGKSLLGPLLFPISGCG